MYIHSLHFGIAIDISLFFLATHDLHLELQSKKVTFSLESLIKLTHRSSFRNSLTLLSKMSSQIL